MTYHSTCFVIDKLLLILCRQLKIDLKKTNVQTRKHTDVLRQIRDVEQEIVSTLEAKQHLMDQQNKNMQKVIDFLTKGTPID
jgi:uncharacterized protein with PIN domain